MLFSILRLFDRVCGFVEIRRFIPFRRELLFYILESHHCERRPIFQRFSAFSMIFFCMVIVMFSTAQPMTVRAIVSAGGMSNNSYAAVGQPFFEQIGNGNYEVAYGVSQAQLDIAEVTDETCENVAYSNNGFDIPTSELVVGTTNYERYDNNVPVFGYDRITKLALSVWPTYATEGSASYHGALPVIPGSKLQDGIDYQVHEGINIINYSSAHGCDSVVTLHVNGCPLTVKDADSNLYNTMLLDKYCWTKSNLHTTHYFGDAHETVPVAFVYNSDYLPAESMETLFGRLYTWYSAVNVPEGSNTQPALDADGFVRGICPAGWHIPTEREVESLESYTGEELRTPDHWIVGLGVNSSEFTMYPAGIYNYLLDRFEGLLTMTRFWYVTFTGKPVAICVDYYCSTFVPATIFPYDAYSVRCVRNYQQ